MEWRHDVSSEWLEARKKYLTATEIVNLIPEYKRFMAGKIAGVSKQFLKLYLTKTAPINGDQQTTFGAAARGHNMEPFSIDVYNSSSLTKIPVLLHHIDDQLIYDPDLLMAWSPDALDIELPSGIEISNKDVKPEYMVECKSYSVSEHINAYYTSEESLPERYQVAAAMAISTSLRTGSVVFYNPNMCKLRMFEKSYTRNDLDEEIATCCGINQIWIDSVAKADLLPDPLYEVSSIYSELEIWESQPWLKPEQIENLSNVFDVRSYR